MQRLWPEPAVIDDVAALVAEAPRPTPVERPWLLVNMITSLDGAIAVEGRSGGLGGPADKAMFAALRDVADVVLVGAGTARAEGYGPPRTSEVTRAARRARGQAPAPRLALVTRSLELDVTSPLFTEADERPFVITSGSADPTRLAAVGEVAELVVSGATEVDLLAALRALRAAGASVITCEGGPRLNGDLIAADVVDEWALTVAPLLVSGDSGRASRGLPPPTPHGMQLDHLLEQDGYLLTRWVRNPRP